MKKHHLSIGLGFFLLVLGILLKYGVEHFPVWGVGAIHLFAAICFLIGLYQCKKCKK